MLMNERSVVGRLKVQGLTLLYYLPHESDKRRQSLLEDGAQIKAPGPLENLPLACKPVPSIIIKNARDEYAGHWRGITLDLDEIVIASHRTDADTVRIMRRPANWMIRKWGYKP